jgi:hypothetical protein
VLLLVSLLQAGNSANAAAKETMVPNVGFFFMMRFMRLCTDDLAGDRSVPARGLTYPFRTDKPR